MFGEEDDIKKIEVYQNAGDFLVYKKFEDKQCPLRLVFVDINEIGEDLKNVCIKKIKLMITENGNKGGKGLGVQSQFPKWFDSLSQLIHDSILPLKSNFMELIYDC